MSQADRYTFPLLNNTNAAEWFPRAQAIMVKKGYWALIAPTVSPTKSDGSAKTATEIAAELATTLAARDTDKMAEARAELILRVDAGQLPYMTSDDPRVIWQNIERMHRAHGFATTLALRRSFLTAKKGDDETMQAWIGRVQAMVLRMDYAGIAVSDQDQILALTMGLPEAYQPVIINFDATPPNDLTLDKVIVRLLNEETRQLSFNHDGPSPALEPAITEDRAVAYAARRTTAELTCFWCDKKGHVKSDCPERNTYLAGKKAGSAMSAQDHTAATVLFEDKELLEW